MWDLSYPTRDQTCALCIGRWSLNLKSEPPRKSLWGFSFFGHFNDLNFKKIINLFILGSSGSSLLLRLFSSFRAWASNWGLLCCWAWALGLQGFSSRGSRAPEHRLSHCGPRAYLLHDMWDSPGSGVQPASPAFGRWVLYHWATWEAQRHRFLHAVCVLHSCFLNNNFYWDQLSTIEPYLLAIIDPWCCKEKIESLATS